MAAISKHRSNTLARGRRTLHGRNENNAGRNGRTHFLNVKYASIPGCKIPYVEAAIGLSDTDMANLRNDVAKFFSAYGIDNILPAPTGNLKLDLLNLYNEVKGNLPNKNWSLEVVHQHEDKGPIKFVVYCNVKFPEYVVWAMPVKKMATADAKTRRLLALTFAVLYRNDMYNMPESNFDFQYNLGQCENDFKRNMEGHTMYDEYFADNCDEEHQEMAVRYLDGDIHELFVEIEETAHKVELLGKPIDVVLEETIRQYRAESYSNERLLDIIEKVLAICREDWLSEYYLSMLEHEFGDDFGNEDGDAHEFMDFARLFFFCYESDDCIIEAVVESLNADACNLAIGGLYRYSFIDSDDVKKRMENDYPERWADINLKLIDILNEQDN